MSARWFVAKVRRGAESALQEQMMPLGVEVYSPEIIVNKAGRRRLEPLFPTYLFCRVDATGELWVRVRHARGLKYVLGSEQRPAPVDDGIIATIEERVRAWNAGGWREAFTPGERVMVTAGPLKGLEAIFVRYLPAKERCKILISTLALQHEVELNANVMTGASGGKRLSAT